MAGKDNGSVLEEILAQMTDQEGLFPRIRRVGEERRAKSIPMQEVGAMLSECLAFMFLRSLQGVVERQLAIEVAPIAWVMGYLYGQSEAEESGTPV